jgi:cytochrome P450
VTNEALRYEPITPFTARVTSEEIEFRGVTFPENTVIFVSSWHANRDGPESPNDFDITLERDGQRLLTFGAGIHYCVGANLARAEIQEALAFLAQSVRSVMPDGAAEFGTPSGIYGLDRLPLIFER